nr:hypothetical protein CFP56_33402 [Quercus suber]
MRPSIECKTPLWMQCSRGQAPRANSFNCSAPSFWDSLPVWRLAGQVERLNHEPSVLVVRSSGSQLQRRANPLHVAMKARISA